MEAGIALFHYAFTYSHLARNSNLERVCTGYKKKSPSKNCLGYLKSNYFTEQFAS